MRLDAVFVEVSSLWRLAMRDGMKAKGFWTLTLKDRDGNVKHTESFENLITNEGKNTILDIMFYTLAKISTWYAGLISSTSYSAVAVGDTMASHAGWTEFTSYAEANRVTWTTGAVASQAVTNGSPMVFSINGSGTVKGIFITSNNTKSGTTGKLWSAALFASDQAVVNGDTLNLTYTVTAS